MLLQDVFNQYVNDQAQVVLSFSNNDEVLVTKDSFDTNSKFYRSSKVRLGVDFVLSGIIKGETFIRTNIIPKNHDEAIIYRTYRGKGKTDYILYIYKGEYKLLNKYKKAVSYKRVIAQTEKQLTFNDVTVPNADKVLHITPHIHKMQYWVAFENRDFHVGIYNTKMYDNTMSYDYLGYMAATLLGLNIAKRYCDRINMVEIHVPNDQLAQGVSAFPTKKWVAKKTYTKQYVEQFDMLKKQLQCVGISICFKHDKIGGE